MADNDGWIKWDGRYAVNPAGEYNVEYTNRIGAVYTQKAKLLPWRSNGRDSDIISYRLITGPDKLPWRGTLKWAKFLAQDRRGAWRLVSQI